MRAEPAGLQMGAAAHEARLDRAQIDAEDFRDLFVAEAFDIAQNNDGLERLGHLADSGLDLIAQFGVGGKVEGRLVLIDQRVLEVEGLAILPESSCSMVISLRLWRHHQRRWLEASCRAMR